MTNRYVSAEIKIAYRLVRDIVAAGYAVSVWEGEDWAIQTSRDKLAILEALQSTNEDILTIHGEGLEPVGSVHLVWGNGCDLICDYHDNPVMRELVAGAEAVANALEAHVI